MINDTLRIVMIKEHTISVLISLYCTIRNSFAFAVFFYRIGHLLSEEEENAKQKELLHNSRSL